MNKPGAVAVVSALMAGVGAGAVIVSASNSSSAAARPGADLQVVSRWSGHIWKGAPQTQLMSGSLGGEPGRGFVLVQTKGQKPGFFSTPSGAGALRLSSVSQYYGWTLRSSNGALVVVSPGSTEAGTAPSFTFLGRRLDPEKLGPIGSRGVAVPFGYGRWQNGRRAQNDVVLVEHTSGWPGWKLDGYLQGFTLPRLVAEQKAQGPVLGSRRELQQPLMGPDGRLYSIDAKNARLTPVGRWRSVVRKVKLGACTTWPARAGAAYRACPNSIRLQKAHGGASTVFRRHLRVGGRSWVFAQPSPNGKWLLLQDAYGACGIATWADFLPSRGGRLWSAFPGAYTSEALGWLPDNTALVAAQSEGCGGNPTAGIYQVRPGDPTIQTPPQLVFAGYVFDATTWGFGGKPAR